ncbi:unnamed protein product [Prunus armeniaca]
MARPSQIPFRTWGDEGITLEFLRKISRKREGEQEIFGEIPRGGVVAKVISGVLFVVVQTRENHDPLPLVGKILKVRSQANMCVPKVRVPRQKVC